MLNLLRICEVNLVLQVYNLTSKYQNEFWQISKSVRDFRVVGTVSNECTTYIQGSGITPSLMAVFKRFSKIVRDNCYGVLLYDYILKLLNNCYLNQNTPGVKK